MARTYAGLLGLIAFVTIMIRCAIHGANIDNTIWSAFIAMVVWAALGWVFAWIAERIVVESVQRSFKMQMAKFDNADVDTDELN